MATATKEVKTQPEQQADAATDESKKKVQSAEFSEVSETEASNGKGSIDVLLDMDVPITVAIGQTEIPVRRLLQLGPGSVLKLSKPIDEPVDLYIRDTKFAAGSVVVVDNRFAVRIKEIFGADSRANESGKTTG